jgi:hypothetical protein
MDESAPVAANFPEYWSLKGKALWTLYTLQGRLALMAV